MLTDALGILIEMLEPTGLSIVFDSKAIRPGVVVIDPPSITIQSANQVRCEFPVTCLTPPPGDAAAEARLLDMADAVLQAVPATSGAPTLYSSGGQNLPGFRLTVPLQIQR